MPRPREPTPPGPEFMEKSDLKIFKYETTKQECFHDQRRDGHAPRKAASRTDHLGRRA